MAGVVIKDIYEGHIWKEFLYKEGSPFLEEDYSIAFILNVDWFQPFSHTQTSIGVIYLTILNLPRYIRYKQEYVILAGIIPGPHESKLTINSYLQPLVDELLVFWNGMTLPVYTSEGIKDKKVRAAVLCVSCDLPAASKVCGFLGHSANLSCSKCLKISPGEVGNKNYSGFERSAWPTRSDQQHRRSVGKIMKCKTKTSRQRKEKELGCRYSCLLDLPYFDATRMLCIDPMHNLFLGTGKHMLSLWKDHGWLKKQHFQEIQDLVDGMIVPSDIGRIPCKIESGFASFKADQFKSWIMIYSIPALHGIPTEHLECWRHFVLACRLLCKHKLSLTKIELADILLLQFCKKVQQLYGTSAITPNIHLHCHLKNVLLDYGPVHEFWLFSFERYNGFLGNQSTNNREIEVQLMKQFMKNSFVQSITFPEEYKTQFSAFVTTEKSIGSVGETSMVTQVAADYYTSLTLPFKYTKDGFDLETVGLLKLLLGKVSLHHVVDNDINVNTIFLKYSSITISGKEYSSSIKQRKGPCIMQALWKEELYGTMPTVLPESYLPGSNIRPVKVHYYAKVFYSVGPSKSSSLFAFVSWLLPHSHRYYLGKPAELWCSGQYEIPDFCSFVPIDNIVSRCAHGRILIEDEELTVVVPLVV